MGIETAAEWPAFKGEIKAQIGALHVKLEDPGLSPRDVDIVRGRIFELRDLLKRVEPGFVPPDETSYDPSAGY